MLMLESTYKAVPAKPVDDLLPNKYKVEVVSVVVAELTEEVAIEAVPVKAPTKVVAVKVFPNAETPERT
jgi:hypothetical protein